MDGCGFSKEVQRHGLARPYDARLQTALALAARHVMMNLPGVGHSARAAFIEARAGARARARR